MKWELFISWRYFKARRKERFISVISLISVLGIALGVMALIVVISVMNGFDQELRQKIVGVNPHIYIEKDEGIDNLEDVLARVKDTKGVLAASGFINGQALLKADEAVVGVLLRGVDPQEERKVSEIESYLVAGSLELADDEIVIGGQLAQKFYLDVDDEITIIAPSDGNKFRFKIGGIFNSGMYEYDLNLVLTNIQSAQKIFNLDGKVAGIGVRLDNIYHSSSVRAHLQEKLGYSYWVRDWMSMNKNLFSALKLEKTVMFVIVALIVVVACFNIAGTLIMMVMEKTKDVGILKSIGANAKSIKKIFIFEGLILGILGTGLGVGLGALLCYLLKTYQFIHLPADIYYIESLPVQMRWADSLIIVAAALLISFLATIYPAHQAAKLNPAEALRYE